MKKPVNFVYTSTINCGNRMELMLSFRAYLRSCEKAYHKNDKSTMKACCNEIDIIIEKLNELSLSSIQEKRMNKCIQEVNKYKEYLQENVTMKSMPKQIKDKLRQLQKAHEKAKQLDMEITTILSEYGVESEYLTAVKIDDKHTEALAFINNAEGNVEENIKDIEDVFLYYVNKK